MSTFGVRRSRVRAAVAAVIVAVTAFGVGNALASHDSDVIHACASNANGSLRLVDSASDCRSNERAVEWTRESPITVPQACPAGQFVTGIDAAGQLTCGTPGSSGGGGGGGGGALRCTDSEGNDGQFETPPELPNATGGCRLATGEVFIAQCDTDFWDLNGVVADGCEYGPLAHTGAEVCDGVDNDVDGHTDDGVVMPSFPNASTVCDDGTTVIFCDPGFDDLDGDISNGCEAVVDSTGSRTAGPRGT